MGWLVGVGVTVRVGSFGFDNYYYCFSHHNSLGVFSEPVLRKVTLFFTLAH